MPSLAFAGSQAIASTGVGQPVFGTSTTAAAQPTYDQFSGNVAGANLSTTTLAVTSTAGFNPGQYVLVAINAQLGSATPNLGRVVSILSLTSMAVAGLTQSVASGAWVILAEAAESIVIQAGQNTGTLYLGTKYTVSSTDASLIGEILSSGSYSFETTALSHAYNTANYFIEGTSGDTFIATFNQG